MVGHFCSFDGGPGGKIPIASKQCYVPEGEGMVLKDQATTKDSENRPSNKGSKVRVYLVIALVLIASGVTAGWVLRYDLLAFRAYSDKDRYLPGESIEVAAKFTNCGFAPVSLTFGTSAKAHFTVYSVNGSYVCEIPVKALMMITHVNLGPGKSVAFEAHWNQTFYSYDYHQDQVPYPCDYYIVAGTLSHEFHATVRTAVFTISEIPSS